MTESLPFFLMCGCPCGIIKFKVGWSTSYKKLYRIFCPIQPRLAVLLFSKDVDAWVCPFGKGPLETLSHIFFYCDLARIFWRSSPWHLTILGFSSQPISQWILAIIFHAASLVIPPFEVRNFQIFASLTFDFIWMSTNKLIHEGLHPSPSKAILHISNTLNLHIAAWRDSSLSSIWLPPSAGSIKCNFDVAVKDSYVVAVITDDHGNIILAAT